MSDPRIREAMLLAARTQLNDIEKASAGGDMDLVRELLGELQVMLKAWSRLAKDGKS